MAGADDRYTDPATGVLRNRLAITDARALEGAETRIVGARIIQLRHSPLPGSYDFAHLQAVHRHLFGDVYAWAGEPRKVQTAKGGRSMFPPPQYIRPAAEELFARLARERHLQGLDGEQLIDRLAYFMGETHAIHPFREGNSRSGRAFYGQLARERGLQISWEQVPRERMEAAKEHAMHVDTSKLASLLTDYSSSPDGE